MGSDTASFPHLSDRATVWQRITDLLIEHNVTASDVSEDPSFEMLDSWYPSDVLNEPGVRFWFDNHCWRFFDLLPPLATLPPSRNIEISALWARISAEYEDGDESSGTAGGWSSIYDRHFVAIADLDGTTLVVDTRPGPNRGCISEYGGGPFDESNVRWGSIDKLLAELLRSLGGTARFANRYTPTFAGGRINWTVPSS